MWWPTPPNKTPRFFQPCPGNDPNNLEPGMYGITDVSAGQEAYYRPFRDNSGDSPATPIRIATSPELAAYVTKALFDANTIIKADADDTPSALTVDSSTLVGRAATGGIAALTATQVAAIINSSIAHNSTSGIDGEGTDHYNSAPATGGAALSVAGIGSDVLSVIKRDTTLLKTISNPGTGNTNTIIANKKSIFVITADDYLREFDRHSGQLLNSSQPLGGSTGGRPMCADETMLYLITSGAIREINLFDITDSVGITATNLDLTVNRGNSCDVLDGDIYNIDFTLNQLQIAVRGASSYTVTNYALTGVTGTIEALIIDSDGTYFYVVDNDTGDIYIRKFDIATRTLQNSSSAITGTYTAAMTLGFSSGYLAVVISGKVYYFSVSDLSMVFAASAVTLTYTVGTLFDGIIYAADDTPEIFLYQPPALTLNKPDFEDGLGGSGIESADGLVDTGGNDIVVTKHDRINTIIDIQPLIQNQFGAVIESVETSELGSPEVGKYYLMDSTSTWYPNTIAFYDIRGWTIYQPYHGAEVRDAGGQYTYEYYTDRWVKKVDMVLTATLTGDGASGTVTDIMTLDVGDTTFPALAAGEFWDVEIDVTGTIDETSLSAPTSGGWYLRAQIQAPNSPYVGYINNSTAPVNLSASGTPHSNYDTPSIVINNSTGAVELTVSITSASTYNFNFTARVRGLSRTGAAYSVV